jgi:serine/threonine protein kinase
MKIGQNIGRYRITDKLGTGGMAIIYKAYDTRLERDVAIKVIRTKAIPAQQHERLMKRFQREAKAQAQFNHPNIVPVYDYGVHEGMPYLVMEYIPGGTLKERISGPVDVQQAVAWVLPIADALAYAHQQGIIHRDVKPSNILITQDNKPLLTDFGIAKVLEANEGTLTATGMGVGTPEYMAPEQWRGETTEVSDQYALGVVLYELLTGQKPFTAETPVAIALKQMKDPLTRPSQLVPGIPEEVEKVIFKALARNPDDRYESMEAFYQALAGTISPDATSLISADRGVEKLNSHAAPPKGNRGSPDRRGRGWLWGLLGGLGVIAGILFVVMGLLGRNGNEPRRSAVDDAGGENFVLAVSGGTATPTQQAIVTITVAPASTLTATPTVTSTPNANYIQYEVNEDYELIRIDFSSGEISKVMDLEVSEGRPTDDGWTIGPEYTFSRKGRFLLYCPKPPEIKEPYYYCKSLYLYDIENINMHIISDKVAEYKLLGFSPNEKNVVFTSTMEGMPGLYLYDIESQESDLIYYWDGFFGDLEIEWDPDQSSIFIMDGNSGKLRRYDNESKIIEDYLITRIEGVNCIKLSPLGDKMFIIGDSPVSIRGGGFVYYPNRLFFVDLKLEEYIEIKSDMHRGGFDFWEWKDNNTIIGSWFGYLSDPYSSESGIFQLSTEDYSVEYVTLSKNRYYYQYMGSLDYALLLTAFGSDGSCLLSYDQDSFSLINKLCFNELPPMTITNDNKKLIFLENDMVRILDLESFEIE